MARARNIKPSIYTNEELAELPIAARWLFVGLWTMADREGRMEDRPRRIKMTIFPGDTIDVDPLLDGLTDSGLIVRYEVEGKDYIWIPGFAKHQKPHHREVESVIPPYEGKAKAAPRHVLGTTQASASPSESPFPITDSSSPKSNGRVTATAFEDWWSAYPKKRKKAEARKVWKSRKLDRMASQLIEDVQARAVRDQRWLSGYIPDPTTYLRNDRWEDEMGEPNETTNRASGRAVRIDEQLSNLRRIAGEEEGGESLDSPRGDVRRTIHGVVCERTE